jgi:acetylornithine aminotransferase/acetylornithine/N-succinyldiaminopimelate aminotransferase
VALVGHSHPAVAAAIASQAAELLFYSSVVHSPARVAAAELLLSHAPHADSRVFFCCSGTEANETAMKLARRATGRRTIVSFTGSFHGRTMGSLSACGLERYRATAGVLAPHHVHVPFGDVTALAAVLDADTAAVLVEPIQSLAGARDAPDEYHRAVARLARDAGAALIYDEVQTGLGRTGKYFFADTVGVAPDLVTLAKGIASGVPTGAVIVAPHLAKTVKVGDHGSTFGGGPLAMAAMRATLEVIERERLPARAARIGALLAAAVRGLAGVRDVHGRGLLIGVELDREARAVQEALLHRRVIAGTSSDPKVLRLLPPLVVGEAEVEEAVEALKDALAVTRP